MFSNYDIFKTAEGVIEQQYSQALADIYNARDADKAFKAILYHKGAMIAAYQCAERYILPVERIGLQNYIEHLEKQMQKEHQKCYP